MRYIFKVTRQGDPILTLLIHLQYIQRMHPNQPPLEIEVKFYLHDRDKVRQRIIMLAAKGRPKTFETNRRYENNVRGLKQAGQLLRLRRDQSWRLTFKTGHPNSDPQFKIYQEWEVSVDDGAAMDAILNALGFQTVQIYEKWRETFHWREATICIDIMPFGTFIEIEGPKADILATAQQLGLKWKHRILTNYLAIFDMLRQKENLAFNDLTFANFEDHPVNMEPYLGLLYQGEASSEQSYA